MENIVESAGLPPTFLWFVSFGLGGAGGLCWLIRSPLLVTPRLLLSALLNSGLCGLTTLLLFHHWMPSVATSLALSGLVGLGGVPTVELLARLAYNLLERYGKKAAEAAPDPSPEDPPESPGPTARPSPAVGEERARDRTHPSESTHG